MPTAEADLASIQRYIGADSPRAAERIGQRLVRTCMDLADFPLAGRPGVLAGTREVTTVQPYVIIYRVSGAIVQILKVWHGRQARS